MYTITEIIKKTFIFTIILSIAFPFQTVEAASNLTPRQQRAHAQKFFRQLDKKGVYFLNTKKNKWIKGRAFLSERQKLFKEQGLSALGVPTRKYLKLHNNVEILVSNRIFNPEFKINSTGKKVLKSFSTQVIISDFQDRNLKTEFTYKTLAGNSHEALRHKQKVKNKVKHSLNYISSKTLQAKLKTPHLNAKKTLLAKAYDLFNPKAHATPYVDGVESAFGWIGTAGGILLMGTVYTLGITFLPGLALMIVWGIMNLILTGGRAQMAPGLL